MTDRDESKLPKWAQVRMAALRSELRWASEKLETVQAMNRLMAEPQRDWFTIPGPALLDDENERPLFVLDRNGAFPVCTLFKGDVLFIGRGREGVMR